MKHGKILLLISSVSVAILFFALVVFTAFAPTYADEVSADLDYNFDVDDADFTQGDFYAGKVGGYATFSVYLDSPASNFPFQVSFFTVGNPTVSFECYYNGEYVGVFIEHFVSTGYYSVTQNIPFTVDTVNMGFSSNNSIPYFVLLGAFCTSSHAYGYYNSAINSLLPSFSSAINASNESALTDSYNKGYSDGKEFGLTSQLSNPVSFFLTPLDSFMNVDIFGAFSLGDMFSVILFVCVALIFIKVFAGG